MLINDEILKKSSLLLSEVSKFQQPADNLLSKFFRDNRKLKAAERNTIAETIYVILRNWCKLSDIINMQNQLEVVAYTWTKIIKIDEKELVKLKSIKINTIKDMPELDENILELPDWVVQRLASFMSATEIKKLDVAMSSQAPLTLRTNTLKINRDELLSKLSALNIKAEASKYSPFGIHLAYKASLMNNQLFLDGYFEVQDESSQLAGLLFDARRSEMIVDFCAGSGGKTLMMGMMMRNQGRIYAFDVNERRLNNLSPRLARSGLSNVYAQLIGHENDTKIKRLIGKADRVFVDAPCLGLGTLRRNPDLKFRQNTTSLAEMNELQLKILKSASRLVKDGGVLLYATCSILREENRDIINAFLAENSDFEIVTLNTYATTFALPIENMNYLELYPHIHGTDGFFACALKKNG